MKTRVLTVHVPLPLAQKVENLASHLGRSRGWIINQALITWVEREEMRYRLTPEALADVDTGQVTDHQAVQAWADGLGKPMQTNLGRSRPGRIRG
jgi:predicted transcriptional regulator